MIWRSAPIVPGLVALLTAGPVLAQGPSRPPSIPELERAARTDSLDRDALYRLALAYDLAKRYDDAEREARQAVAVDPREAQAWLLLARIPYELGLVEQQLGHVAEAKAMLTRFLAIAPSRLGTAIADAKQRLADLP